MTPQQVIGLGIRLVSLWLVTNTITYIAFIPSATSSAEVSGQAHAAYWVGGAYLLGAALLWFFPMWIAHRLLPRTKFENKLEMPALEVARVGCSLIGLWIFSHALPVIAWVLLRAFVDSNDQSFFRTLTPGVKLDVAIYLFQIVLSLVLILRSGDFAQLIYREKL